MKQKLETYGLVLEQVSLKDYCTFKVGGIAQYIVFPTSKELVLPLIKFLKMEEIDYFILGNGSNLIFADTFIPKVFISFTKLNRVRINGTDVIAEAGVMMPSLAMQTIQNNLKGLEWAAGIPGTVGGCVYGNAEAYKTSTFDLLKQVSVITPNGELLTFEKEDLSYGYRTSFFKENSGYVILEAVFSLEFGTKEESMEIVRKRRKQRILTQPLEYPSAGSVFRNPKDQLPCGKLIEDLGFKGTRVGDAQVSQKHANFIINCGNATGKDIRNLIELVHQAVKDSYQIDLIMEQEYVGWDSYETK